ncbi:hypothetical protein GCM10022223_55580 [Kineosporia mesophila]|uniref:N-acetyltransferase domain-containing protein n=1 Tax=Kineosporia mesophila TaxID=566012 RepID=A0ABP7AF33_9ACTN
MFRVHESEWRVLREARLKALETSPEAFCGNYARERLVHRRTWRRRAHEQQWTVARSGSRIIGLVGMLDEPDREEGPLETRCIESVWVHPDFRRRGLVRLMLQGIEEQALRQGVGTLILWVLESNRPAWEVYRRLGYRPTGLFQDIAAGGRLEVEHRLKKVLT